MVTHLENWPWNSEGLGAFYRHGNLAGCYGNGLILFHDNGQLHSKLRTFCCNYLGKRASPVLFIFVTWGLLAVCRLEGALIRTSFTCNEGDIYHQMVD
jgi:hypothetical protein